MDDVAGVVMTLFSFSLFFFRSWVFLLSLLFSVALVFHPLGSVDWLLGKSGLNLFERRVAELVLPFFFGPFAFFSFVR